MKTCIKKLFISLYFSLSFLLYACGVNNGGSVPVNTSATTIAQALTIDNVSTVPVFPNNSTTSVVYVHNNSNQHISNIKYTIINDDSINQVTNSFTIDASDCETIDANSRCAIAFTTPVLSGTNTQGSVVLVATYGNNSYSQIINYNQILDNSNDGVFVSSDASIAKQGNSTGYTILYAYAGNSQSYLLQKLSTSNTQFKVVDNLSNKMLSNNVILPIEVSSVSSIDSQIILNISYKSLSGNNLNTSISIMSIASHSGPILISGLAPIINTKVTSIGSFSIVNSGNQPATISSITYSLGVSAESGANMCGSSLQSYSNCMIYFKVPESGTSGSINIFYNNGRVLAQTVAWYNGNGKGMVMGMSSSQNMIGFVANSSESKSILVTVKNLGAYSLDNIISSATFLNGSATATIADNTCNGITLAIGSTCTYKVNMRDAVAESNRQISFNIKGTYNNGESYSRVLVTNYNVILPKILAVGDSGTLATVTLESQFNINQRKSGGNDLWEVLYTGTQFITVGQSKAIFKSPDGITWTSSNSGITNSPSFYGLASNGGTIIIVGDVGIIYGSVDGGNNWTSRTSVNNNTLYEAGYLGGKFIAVGASEQIITSNDGVVWLSRNSGSANNTFRGIAYNGSVYVASGLKGLIKTSITGESSWVSRDSGTTRDLLGSTYGNGKFVLVGVAGTILTSSDGITWESRVSGSTQNLTQVSYNSNGAQFMAVGTGGTILTSPDAITWTNRTPSPAPTSSFDGVANNGSVFVFVGSGGQIYTSNIIKNTQYSTIGSSSKNLYGITFGGQVFAVGDTGSILASSNGINWESRNSGTTKALRGINYNGVLLTTVGESGTILVSSNGVSWESRASGTFNTLFSVSYGNGKFVAVGAGGTILTSESTSTWTPRTSGTNNTLYSVNYSNGKFVVVGSNGTILSSSDGVTWTLRTSGVTSELRSITYGNQQFIAVGGGGKILTSQDGVNWISQNSGVTNNLLGVSYSAGYCFAVGQSGIVIYSIDDGASWISQSSTTTNLNAVIVLL